MAADGMATQRTRSSAALVLVLFRLLNILDFKKKERGLIHELAAVLFLKYSQLNILSKHFLEQQSFKY